LHKTHRLLVLLALSLLMAVTVPAQSPRRFPFRADHYDVQVLLHPEDQTISGLARVDFIANEVSRTVVVELHQDLKLNLIRIPGGKPLEFERDRTYPLLLTVGLPDAVAPGQPVTLEFDYTGPISSEDDSPTRGVRFASIDKTSAYLLLPARWFPLTNYPANRYTGTFKIITPDTMYVTGTGKADPPTMQPASERARARRPTFFIATAQVR
jgi:hypothetical protein